MIKQIQQLLFLKERYDAVLYFSRGYKIIMLGVNTKRMLIFISDDSLINYSHYRRVAEP